MALVKDNDITMGLSGKFESILFKTFRGKTFAYPEPKKPTKQSEQQRKNRDRFRDASYYAKSMMDDPERKKYYQRLAKKLDLPNAYTAAITDYMRKPQIGEVIVSDSVTVEAEKKHFKVAAVTIRITDADHRVIEQGEAQLNARSLWYYRTVTVNLHEMKGYRIIITAEDATGQQVEKIIV